ncbi:hypothetical protein CMI37_16415 [Candidatus Pacearchaeota archaeon]|nr:hypothetical protein [Candidatus Pacearchaeota archaeon]
MGKRVTSSEGHAPESTAVASRKTDSSLAPRSEASAVDAPRPSSTGSEPRYSADEQRFPLILGALMARSFTSTDQVSMWVRRLQDLGFEEEVLALVDGFNNNRPGCIQDFMG